MSPSRVRSVPPSPPSSPRCSRPTTWPDPPPSVEYTRTARPEHSGRAVLVYSTVGGERRRCGSAGVRHREDVEGGVQLLQGDLAAVDEAEVDDGLAHGDALRDGVLGH